MAKNLVLENEVVNAQASAFATLCNNGYLRIKTSGNVLLAELRLNATAFGAPIAGVLTANAITPEDAAVAEGVASKYELYKSDGTSLLCTGTVGTSDADLVISSVNISLGTQVSVTSFTHTTVKSA